MNKLNRLVNIDPNLQRLRDISGQLFLTDEQVEQLVNYVQMYMRGVGLFLAESNTYNPNVLRKSYSTINRIEPIAGISIKEHVMVSDLWDGFISCNSAPDVKAGKLVTFVFASRPLGFIAGDEEGGNRWFELPSLVGCYSVLPNNGVANCMWPKVDDNSPIICEGGNAQIVLPADLRNLDEDFGIYVSYIGLAVWFS